MHVCELWISKLFNMALTHVRDILCIHEQFVHMQYVYAHNL